MCICIHIHIYSHVSQANLESLCVAKNDMIPLPHLIPCLVYVM